MIVLGGQIGAVQRTGGNATRQSREHVQIGGVVPGKNELKKELGWGKFPP